MENNPARIGRWSLIGASILLVAAVAYSAMRSKDSVQSAPVAAKSALPANQAASIESLQAQAKASPQDVDRWAALGEALFARSRFDEAVAAYEHGADIAPSRADLWSALGEARVMASPRDPMPPAALIAFRKALAINPKDPRSRYFDAVAKDLTGDHGGAIDDWLALLKDTPPGAPWENDLRRTISQVGKINKIDVEPRLAAIAPAGNHAGMNGGQAMPGPSPEQIQAAAALTPSQQDTMAQQMVAQLENKLKVNPTNVDGWVMLIRSRKTLGDTPKAQKALSDAISANPSATTRLQAEAAAMGVVKP